MPAFFVWLTVQIPNAIYSNRFRNKKAPSANVERAILSASLMALLMAVFKIASISYCRKGVWRMEWDSNPRKLLASPVFKTGAFNHSAILPGCIGARSFRILYERRSARKEEARSSTLMGLQEPQLLRLTKLCPTVCFESRLQTRASAAAESKTGARKAPVSALNG